MRYLGIAIVFGLAGCGGSGSGGGGAGQLPGPGPGPEALAQQILEQCGAEALQQLLDLGSLFTDLLDPSEPIPDFQVTGLNGLPPTGFSWTLDLDQDSIPDLEGVIEFFDDQGNPTVPFDVADLIANGFTNFDDLVATIPDGTVLSGSFNGTTDPMLAGGVDIVFDGGAPDTLENGTFSAQVDTCNALLQFAGILFADLLGDFPAAEANFQLNSPDGSLAGFITFDGSETATVRVMLDGEPEEFVFLVNLNDGSVVPGP